MPVMAAGTAPTTPSVIRASAAQAALREPLATAIRSKSAAADHEPTGILHQDGVERVAQPGAVKQIGERAGALTTAKHHIMDSDRHLLRRLIVARDGFKHLLEVRAEMGRDGAGRHQVAHICLSMRGAPHSDTPRAS